MLSFLGGVPKALVCDNLKAGVTAANRYEPGVNRTYQDLAAHYGTTIVPARPRKPRDKAKVEAAVLIVQRWILARLRNRRFFSLAELNVAIRTLVDELNARLMRKLGASRREFFDTIDRAALMPLPAEPYQYAEWRRARVAPDYHVEVAGHFYSVPSRMIRQVVEVRATEATIEVFHRGSRIASHARSGMKRRHTTIPEHMPSAHRRYAFWTPARLLAAAEKIGPSTVALCETIMRTKPHPEQGFRSCLRRPMGRSASKPPAAVGSALAQRAIGRSLRSSRPASTRPSCPTPPPTPSPSGTATSVAAATTTDQQEGDPMLINHTHERLVALGLAGMAKAFDDQQRQPDVTALTFEQRLGLMIDREATERENKRLVVRLKFASLRQAAIVEDADLRAPRGIDRAFFAKLVDGDWIGRKQNLLITGPTGVGKSWIACALGHKACRDNRSVLYHRLPRLFEALALARGDGRYARLLKMLSRVDLLILDDWGLAPLTGDQRRDLLEVVDDRHQRGSTIITSQVPIEHWHEVIADPTIADAVLDRLVHNAHRLTLKGDSMRKIAAQRANLDATKKT